MNFNLAYVFPTHVGMNRAPSRGLLARAVFPTHVGMNRTTS